MLSTIASRTFAVSDVTPATKPLPELVYHQAVAEFLLEERVEACSQYHGRLVRGVRSHPFLAALHMAFADHRSVCLSPDIIWLTILQGLALHVNSKAEQLRKHFVRHDRKLELVVSADDFLKGSPENDWPRVFSQFSEQIREHIGEVHNLIIANFSTTGPVERAAQEVALLDTMQSYFEYTVKTVCGIPAIRLEGTVEDWKEIARRVQVFRAWELDWWIDPLEPILNQFVAAAEGSVDRTFWESIYKWKGPEGSGGTPHVSGWVLNLFPYLDHPRLRSLRREGVNVPSIYRNRWLGPTQTHDGPEFDHFPIAPSKAPFKWLYRGKTFEMAFVGGLIGVRQEADSLCLQPEIGWAILDRQRRRSGRNQMES